MPTKKKSGKKKAGKVRGAALAAHKKRLAQEKRTAGGKKRAASKKPSARKTRTDTSQSAAIATLQKTVTYLLHNDRAQKRYNLATANYIRHKEGHGPVHQLTGFDYSYNNPKGLASFVYALPSGKD